MSGINFPGISHIPLGLPDHGDLLPDIQEMKRIIRQHVHDVNLIAMATYRARMDNLYPEDEYALLAYAALVALEKSHRAHMELLNKLPMPGIIFQDKKRG